MAAPARWTQIEEAAEQPASTRARGAAEVGSVYGVIGVDRSTTAGPARPRARLRRQHRPILGTLDAGGVVLQRNAAAAILGSAVFVVPLMVVNLVVSRLAYDRFESFDDVVISVPQVLSGVEAESGVETLLTYISLVFTSLAVALAGAFVALLVIRRALGMPVSTTSNLAIVARRLPVLVLAWAISHSWVFLAEILAVHVSLGALAGVMVLAAAPIIWLIGLTAFVAPVVVAERLGPWRSVRRAIRLSRARGGTVFGFSAACVLLGGGLRLAISALPWLIESTGLFSFGRFGSLAVGIAGQLAQLIVIPLIGLATATMYLQVRMDAEGLDLVLEAERAFP
jgi:hypothetical protein